MQTNRVIMNKRQTAVLRNALYNALTMHARVTSLAKGYDNRHQSYSKNNFHRKNPSIDKSRVQSNSKNEAYTSKFLKKKLHTYTFRDCWQSSYIRSNEIQVLIHGKKKMNNLCTQQLKLFLKYPTFRISNTIFV